MNQKQFKFINRDDLNKLQSENYEQWKIVCEENKQEARKYLKILIDDGMLKDEINANAPYVINQINEEGLFTGWGRVIHWGKNIVTQFEIDDYSHFCELFGWKHVTEWSENSHESNGWSFWVAPIVEDYLQIQLTLVVFQYLAKLGIKPIECTRDNYTTRGYPDVFSLTPEQISVYE